MPMLRKRAAADLAAARLSSFKVSQQEAKPMLILSDETARKIDAKSPVLSDLSRCGGFIAPAGLTGGQL
jgi:hypothetical protein